MALLGLKAILKLLIGTGINTISAEEKSFQFAVAGSQKINPFVMLLTKGILNMKQ